MLSTIQRSMSFQDFILFKNDIVGGEFRQNMITYIKSEYNNEN